MVVWPSRSRATKHPGEEAEAILIAVNHTPTIVLVILPVEKVTRLRGRQTPKVHGVLCHLEGRLYCVLPILIRILRSRRKRNHGFGLLPELKVVGIADPLHQGLRIPDPDIAVTLVVEATHVDTIDIGEDTVPGLPPSLLEGASEAGNGGHVLAVATCEEARRIRAHGVARRAESFRIRARHESIDRLLGQGNEGVDVEGMPRLVQQREAPSGRPLRGQGRDDDKLLDGKGVEHSFPSHQLVTDFAEAIDLTVAMQEHQHRPLLLEVVVRRLQQDILARCYPAIMALDLDYFDGQIGQDRARLIPRPVCLFLFLGPHLVLPICLHLLGSISAMEELAQLSVGEPTLEL
mmetsp:Transcript_16394/g.36218  ORF Transcript_16394/g.36218 Transcript_16394/m.36218 type:complete len:348 (-) Transcript_16394:291-1334(-)